ncbi:MAG: hypothetical protein KAU62_14685 [Candidatus Heimdallarchaeota archaeon]|nr:hypothetical protein [Candidatus Heimdallarchaeota archaeon]MCK4612398.1 hypothetical protein [Candidatus Heimdallarchaeota archaeon]
MILVECNADEALINNLFPDFNKSEFSHEGNKTGVIKRLIRNQNSSGFVGLIDQDPGTNPPGYYHKFHIIETHEGLNFKILKASNNSILVELYPNLEGWIIHAAHVVHIPPKDFGLSDSENELHKELLIKSNIPKFNNLLNDVKIKSKNLQKLESELRKFHFSV